ncbi:hypothetical protein ACIA5D_36625 [Actinoplanes sp. NPDC051513]|uniref:hypothetical protein n=1 Tax=Actinoplanes sp. NPDC051513 TaxID=3363908 RepID=UPI0037A4EF23
MSRAYETTNRRYLDVNEQAGRDRQRTRSCPSCAAKLPSGALSCDCGWTASRQAVTR